MWDTWKWEVARKDFQKRHIFVLRTGMKKY